MRKHKKKHKKKQTKNTEGIMYGNMDNKVKHLEMIENIIQRMANNSFQLKGWAVTLVGVIGAFASQGSDKRFFLLAFVPLIAFWFLDSFYLLLERKYKVMYKNVSDKAEEEIDFSMDLGGITATGDDVNRLCYGRCLFSRTEAWFYLPIMAAVIVLAIILIWT